MRSYLPRAFFLVPILGALALAGAACGEGLASDPGRDRGDGGSSNNGSSESGSGGGSGSGSGGSISPDAGDGSAAATSPCTVVMPQAGDPCTVDKLACEYGTDPALECDTIMTCTGGMWTTTQTPFTGGMFCSTTVTNPSCPASLAEVMQGTTCGSSFFECYFPQARCECRCPGPGDGSRCVPPDTAKAWQCDSSSTPRCPAVRPRLGVTCSTQNLVCSYGGANATACWGDRIACMQGVWVNAGDGFGC